MTKLARILLTVTQIVLIATALTAVSLTTTPNAMAATVTLVRPPNIQNIVVDETTNKTAFTVVWTTAENVASEVQYGIGGFGETAVATSYRFDTNASSPYDTYYVHEATLSELTPNTDYQYKIYSDGIDITSGGSVTVNSGRLAQHSSFSFASLGDSGTGSSGQQGVAARLAQVDPDLILHAGDMNYETTYTTIETWFFQMYANNLDHTWFTPLAGNHDMDDGGAIVTNSFIVPPNGASDPIERELYYSFDYGNAHFLVLTSELSTSNGSNQYNFAANDLANTDQFWKVVVMHEPPYWGTVRQYSNIVDLFEQHDVDIVISGDRHFYERLHPILDDNVTTFADGGIHYFVSGGGGTGLTSVSGSSWGERVVLRAREFHFVLFEVEGCEIAFKAVRGVESGDAYDASDIFDSTTISKCPPGDPADLAITKSDTADPVVVGGDVGYTVQVTNNGPETADNVVVADNLPSSLTFVSATPDVGSCSHDSGTITCDLGSLTDGATVDIAIVTTTTAVGTLTNNASVSSDTYDDNSGNNSSSEQTTVTNTPPSNSELSITKTDAVDPIDVGENIEYAIAMTNHGPETAKSVVVVDTLPAGVIFVSATPDVGSCTEESGTITCDLGDVADGVTVNIDVVVTANAVGDLTNNVTVTGNVTGDDGSDNSASATTTVEGSVTNAALNPIHDAYVAVGGSGTNDSVLRLRNGSSGSERRAYLKFDASSITGGVQSATLRLYVNNGSAGAQHAVYAVSNDYSDGSGAWIESGINGTNAPTIGGSPLDTISSQAAGSWEEFDVTSAVNGGIVSFAVTRTDSGNHYYDSDEGTNRPELVVVSFVGTADSDLSTTMTDAVDPVTVGDNVTYTITVTNNGPDTAENVTLTDTLPTGVTFVSATPDAGSCGESGGTVTCDLGSLANGAQVEVVVVVTTTAVSTLANNASVTSDSDDPNGGNNAALEQTVVEAVAAPDIALSTTSVGSGQVPNSQRVKSFAIANDGNAALNWSLVEAETAVCATPDDIAWATLSTNSGSTVASASDSVDVTFDSTGLADGSYSGELCVQSDDPDTPVAQLSLTLAVCTAPSPLTVDGIAVNGNTNTVSWTGSATQQFLVWWGANEPYFAPGADCAAAANCAVVDKATNSYAHTVADNSISYTYIVIADNVCGSDVVSSANSNVKAEFGFALVPGG